jgi:hypothetical protein
MLFVLCAVLRPRMQRKLHIGFADAANTGCTPALVGSSASLFAVLVSFCAVALRFVAAVQNCRLSYYWQSRQSLGGLII